MTCRFASFRICELVVGRPYGTLHRAAAPMSMCFAHGITPSGRNALPDHRYVWNPSSFTVTSSVNVDIVWCRDRLPLRPEPCALISFKLLTMPNQVVSTGWSKVSSSWWDMTVWWGFNAQDKVHCENKKEFNRNKVWIRTAAWTSAWCFIQS